MGKEWLDINKHGNNVIKAADVAEKRLGLLNTLAWLAIISVIIFWAVIFLLWRGNDIVAEKRKKASNERLKASREHIKRQCHWFTRWFDEQ